MICWVETCQTKCLGLSFQCDQAPVVVGTGGVTPRSQG